MEEWKQIPEYPNYYISNLARVKNDKGRILRQYNNLPMVDLRGDKAVKRHSVAKLFYSAFVGGDFKDNEHFIYLDGDPTNITVENVISRKQRQQRIIEMYKNNEKLITISNKYKLSIRRIKNMLWESGLTIKKKKEFELPKHHSKGKMETQVVKGEFTIPYRDNCTVNPRHLNSTGYLLKQFCYNH